MNASKCVHACVRALGRRRADLLEGLEQRLLDVDQKLLDDGHIRLPLPILEIHHPRQGDACRLPRTNVAAAAHALQHCHAARPLTGSTYTPTHAQLATQFGACMHEKIIPCMHAPCFESEHLLHSPSRSSRTRRSRSGIRCGPRSCMQIRTPYK